MERDRKGTMTEGWRDWVEQPVQVVIISGGRSKEREREAGRDDNAYAGCWQRVVVRRRRCSDHGETGRERRERPRRWGGGEERTEIGRRTENGQKAIVGTEPVYSVTHLALGRSPT